MKITKANLTIMINEAVQNALTSYDPTGAVRESPEEKKARREGKKQAVEKFSGSSVEDLKRKYLELEQKAEQHYQDTLKSAFIWGGFGSDSGHVKENGDWTSKEKSRSVDTLVWLRLS